MASCPSLQVERRLWESGKRRVVGVDEAGLGPLAGPVVAAAFRLRPGSQMIDGVRDSKSLSSRQRERLFREIMQQAVAVGVGAASVKEIEQMNILNASRLAMCRAIARAGPHDHLLVDGRDFASSSFGPHTAIVGGDVSCYSIACASIVAKVVRDRLMRKLAAFYPMYGWHRNMGYGTAEHLAALRRFGPSPFHRRGYAPIRGLLGLAAPPSGQAAQPKDLQLFRG